VSELGYVQARIQARYGRRPSEALWRQLAAAKDLRGYLENARGTVLAPWVLNLSGASDVHDIEHSMRGHFAAAVTEVASWMPDSWRPAVLWVRWLVYLPALRYLLYGSPVLAWMREGHGLRPYAHEDPETRQQAMLRDGLAPLVEAYKRGHGLDKAWLETWRKRWPHSATGVASSLNCLAALVERHVQQFGSLEKLDGWPARRDLLQHLERLFRRSTLSPTAVFAFLALLSLDLERLRADLVFRTLFPADKAGP
jgi:hypothetical protein